MFGGVSTSLFLTFLNALAERQGSLLRQRAERQFCRLSFVLAIPIPTVLGILIWFL